MKRLLIFLVLLIQSNGFSQNDPSGIFKRISTSLETFEIDTSAVPNDKLSEKIKELRKLKGGFNINEAMEYKVAESHSKGELSDIEFEKISVFLNSGNGKKWLENATVWIYRKHFTFGEIKQLVRFYRTSAGQKYASDFPIIMVETVKAAEIIMGSYSEK